MAVGIRRRRQGSPPDRGPGLNRDPPKAVTWPARRAAWPSAISRKPAKNNTAAACGNRPTANNAAAAEFTANPRNVKALGVNPVAASPVTTCCKSQPAPSPIHAVIGRLRVFVFLVHQPKSYTGTRVRPPSAETLPVARRPAILSQPPRPNHPASSELQPFPWPCDQHFYTFYGARGGGRTHTTRKRQGILSPPRMPFRHPGNALANLS